MLKTVYFMRHGLAFDREKWTDDDALRPLTDKGIQKMQRTAGTMAGMKLGIDLILTSPLVRAHQTAEIVAKKLDLVKCIVQDDRLGPGFDLLALSECLKDHPDAEVVLLVGHEPDFSQTMAALIGGGNLVCKKGGLGRVEVILEEPLQGELLWLLPPGLLN